MGYWDEVTGESKEPEKPKGRNQPRGRGKGRDRDVTTGSEPQTRAQKNVRPDEVSERVWGLAEQWLDMGEAHFGRGLIVNRQKFSRRLSDKIETDPNLGRWLRRKPEYWARIGRWDDGFEFVHDVVAKMVNLFWAHIIEGQKNTSGIQFDFLNTEWDEWVYQAVTAVQVAWLKGNSTWAEPALPSAVFDASTVGRPGDDEPCTDPEFPGMTWGEVRALREEDSRDLPSISDMEVIAEEAAEYHRRAEHFAMLKAAMLANREDHHEGDPDATPPA